MQFHHILVNNRQKTSADGICFSLHVLSMFSPLLLLLLSVNLLSTEFSDRSKLSSYCSSTLVRCCDKLTASWKCCYIYILSVGKFSQSRQGVFRTELSMGSFCVTLSNLTHHLTDPTRPDPVQLTNLTAWCHQVLSDRPLMH